MNSDLEARKWAFERNQRQAERAHDKLDDFCTEVNAATVQSGQLALRMAMLINGGAAVAVLAFLGALSSSVGMEQVSRLASTIEWFAWGVGVAVAGMGAAYFTNYCHTSLANSLVRTWEHPFTVPTRSSKIWDWTGNVFHVLAIAAGVGSLILFIMGMCEVREGIRQVPPPAPTSAIAI
ncbi:hypothetical protein [Hyphomicrobium sp.]|uniref:hypothetical protein n=1 Tax=Hyphomicrobium sp. TaxID=82 RepID=UPI002FE30475